MELFFIPNIHAQGLHTLYLIKKLLPRKLTQFINLFLELINFTLFGMWTCHNGFMVANKFLWNFLFDFNASQFQWMVSDKL